MGQVRRQQKKADVKHSKNGGASAEV